MRNYIVVGAEEIFAGAKLDREFVMQNEHAILVRGTLEDIEAEVARHRRDTTATPSAVDADVVVVGEEFGSVLEKTKDRQEWLES